MEDEKDDEKERLISNNIFTSSQGRICQYDAQNSSRRTISTAPFRFIFNKSGSCIDFEIDYSTSRAIRYKILNKKIKYKGHSLFLSPLEINFTSKSELKRSIEWLRNHHINVIHKRDKKQKSKRKHKDISRYKAKFRDREAAEFSIMETIIIYCVICVVIIIPIFWFFAFKVTKDYERGIVLRLGKIRGKALTPGVSVIIPFIDDMRIVDMRVQTIKLHKTSIMCADAMTIEVTGVIYTKAINPWPLGLSGGNCNGYFANLSYPILRDVIGKYSLMDLLCLREEINHSLKYLLQKETYKYGVDVCNFEIKDILLPKDMQRSIASEAESKRNKEATIINAIAEVESAKCLSIAAKKLNQSKGSLILRYLHTVNKIATQYRSTVLFPYVMDFRM